MPHPNEDARRRACGARHLGLWAIDPQWLARAVAAVKAGLWPMRAWDDGPEKAPPIPTWVRPASAVIRDGDGQVLYGLGDDGIATVGVEGPLIKGDSKFGGTNSVRVRQAVRMLWTDEAARAVALVADSPGGTIAGTDDLAMDVAKLAERKPVYGRVEDLAASATYWILSQARRISASRTSEVGSIGIFAVIEDTSGQYALEGIQVHVISTGAYKGAFIDGTPVTSEQLAYIQGQVDGLQKQFIASVAQGRGVAQKTVGEWADGRVWLAGEALKMGLIDAVETIDEFYETIRSRLARTQNARRAKAEAVRQSFDLA